MSALDSLYQDIILEHAKVRSGSGLATHPAAEGTRSGQSHQLNPVCGDEITVRVDLLDETIVGLHWDGAGCAISMASASVLSELLTGLERAPATELIDQFREMMRSRGQIEATEEIFGDAAALSGVSRYAARVKCAMLAWVAAEDSLAKIV